MNKRNTIKQLLHRGCLLMGISAITSSAFAWDFAEHRKIGDRAMSLLPALSGGKRDLPQRGRRR